MVSKKVSVWTVAVLLGIAVGANAGTVRFVPVDNSAGGASTANVKTTDILIDVPAGQQLLSQQMRIQITGGQMFEFSPGGSNTAPSNSLLGFFPGLAFDSFISAGYKTAEEGPGPTVVGKSDRFGGPGGTPASFAPTGYDVLYGPPTGANVTNFQNYLSARLSIQNTANGTIGFRAGFNDGSEFFALTIPIINGAIVPEPASCALIGLAMFGLVGFVRRRTM